MYSVFIYVFCLLLWDQYEIKFTNVSLTYSAVIHYLFFIQSTQVNKIFSLDYIYIYNIHISKEDAGVTVILFTLSIHRITL